MNGLLHDPPPLLLRPMRDVGALSVAGLRPAGGALLAALLARYAAPSVDGRWICALAHAFEGPSPDRWTSLAPAGPKPAALATRPVAPVPAVGPAFEAASVRGVLAERVVVSTLLDPFLPLKALAKYSGISYRKLRDHCQDPVHPLPHYRIGTRIFVRRSEFDAWIAAYRKSARADADRIVEEALAALARP
jgi:hypothetical protein